MLSSHHKKQKNKEALINSHTVIPANAGIR
jgi:hypothetical protein